VKTIRDFVLGKIRRTEVEDLISLELQGTRIFELGEYQGTLRGPAGEVDLYADGLVFGAKIVRYEALQNIAISPVKDGQRQLALTTQEGIVWVEASEMGGEVLFATLRWIGRALLRRPLD